MSEVEELLEVNRRLERELAAAKAQNVALKMSLSMLSSGVPLRDVSPEEFSMLTEGRQHA